MLADIGILRSEIPQVIDGLNSQHAGTACLRPPVAAPECRSDPLGSMTTTGLCQRPRRQGHLRELIDREHRPMISPADFPDLFPSMAEPKRRIEFRQRTDPPYDVCIARWEDDEGQILDSASPLPEIPYAGDGRRDPLGTGILFSIMPVFAAISATVAILSMSGGSYAEQRRRDSSGDRCAINEGKP